MVSCNCRYSGFPNNLCSSLFFYPLFSSQIEFNCLTKEAYIHWSFMSIQQLMNVFVTASSK